MEKSELLSDIKRYVNYLLLPLEAHYYHQYEHSLDVMERAVYLWEKEWATEEELEILAVAALFHDTGFIIQYDNNEYIGAKIAHNYLKTILYPENKIKQVEKLILSTSPDVEPESKLEEIIKDADLDNLGRDDFFENSKRVKKELETIKNIKIKDPEWHHASLDIIGKNTFYTKTQTQERGKKRAENEEKLRKQL